MAGRGEKKSQQQLPQIANKGEIGINPDKISVIREHLLTHFRNLVLTGNAGVDTHQIR